MSMTTDKIRVSTYIDAKLKRQSEALADMQGRSLSNYIEQILKQEAAKAVQSGLLKDGE